jgi:MFS family permease
VPSLNPVRAVSSLIPEPGPSRPFALATLINIFGSGLLLVSMPLYFTRIVHLTAAQVGLGLTIAGIVTLAVGFPIGDFADRHGPLEIAKAMLVVQCCTTLAFLFIGGFASFVAVATVDAVAACGFISANGPLLRRLADGENAAGFRASMHSLENVGLTLGIAACSFAIEIGTPTAYHVTIIFDALSFLVAYVALRQVPHFAPLPKPASAPRWGVLRDRPFVAYTALSAVFVLEFRVITLLLPLWVVEYTHAPRWCIPLSLVINTILVVLLQVRTASGVQTISQGGVAWRRAGVIFLFSCSALGFATGLPGWAALLLVVAGVCLHTAGEMWHMAGAFALSFNLPPAHAQGQYGGFLGIGGSLGGAAAPVLLLGLALSHGRPGLIGLGAFFALAGLLMPAVARWGERTRPVGPGSGDREEAGVSEAGVSEPATDPA